MKNKIPQMAAKFRLILALILLSNAVYASASIRDNSVSNLIPVAEDQNFTSFVFDHFDNNDDDHDFVVFNTNLESIEPVIVSTPNFAQQSSESNWFLFNSVQPRAPPLFS